MIRVKICGITNLEDALAAAEFGADAVGFVLYPNSPRYIKPAQAKLIIDQLPPYVTPVGVFADQPAEEIWRMMEECGFDLVQLQGDESPEFCQRFGSRVVKAIRVKDHGSLKQMAEYSVRAFVLDTYRENQLGGTGERFDWDLAVQARSFGRIVLAGGLTPENVRDAIRKVQPYGVDVSTGVEKYLGKKDHSKIENFIKQAKSA
ncbi:MAG TPA: phosphoribosylanthranilate isomerase [Nitrospiria bacterium]|nr:phosphoribosylanthranilate isomerase [Nitrospiria bacterium]